MRWTLLIASLAALLSSDGGSVLAIVPPEDVTVPFLDSFSSAPLEYVGGRSSRRDLTWYTSHRTPREITDAGMDPASPSTNEWIARAHYKQLVKQFKGFQLYAARKKSQTEHERAWQIYTDGDIHKNKAIEALWGHSYGTLTVAVLYDPVSKLHFVSTVPRKTPGPPAQSIGIAKYMFFDGRDNNRLWFKAASGGSAGTSVRYHAEDGAYYFFELKMRNSGVRYAENGHYIAGRAIGAWGGASDYPLVEGDAVRTTVDSEGKRYDLCMDGARFRGSRGCQTVASRLNVAFNGDGTHFPEEYEHKASACSQDSRPLYIRGREVACPLNLKPSATSKAVKGSKAASSCAVNASSAPKSKGLDHKSASPTGKHIVSSHPLLTFSDNRIY